jgi:hypothetical protein
MTAAPYSSRRQAIAQRFAERLGVPIQRVEHGGARASRGRGANKRKHYYMIIGAAPTNVVVEVFGESFIVVAGHFCKTEAAALTHLATVLGGSR